MPETRHSEQKAASLTQKRSSIALWIIAILCVVLRVAALSSDAYPRLSWSSGLLTDEGFYLHNARNLVLFGNAQQDEWNNALIMPTLHAVQVGVFRVFGVGIVQTRLISVGFSFVLLTAAYFAVKRWKPETPTAALLAVLFLGLDHWVLLYNRLGLLDTPAVTLLVCAWACFVAGIKSERTAFRWGLACGLFLVLAYTIRGFAALLFLCPFFAALPSWRSSEPLRRLLAGTAAGLILGMACYFAVWYLPNRTELSRYNAHYLYTQLMPHSLHQFRANVQTGLFYWARGVLPYVLRHTPVVFGLAVWECIAFVREKARREDPAERFLVLWFVMFFILCCCVDYAPSRYYVLFAPPMMLLASKLVGRWVVGSLGQDTAEPGTKTYPSEKQASYKRANWQVIVLIWASVNGYWLTDWIGHLTYRQIAADRYLAQTLPPESWLIGAVAPGLCINNRLHPVNMIAGLCNDKKPVEKHAGKPRYVLILDGNWRERYFAETYPEIVTEAHKIHTFQGLLRPFFEIGVYKVPEDFGAR